MSQSSLYYFDFNAQSLQANGFLVSPREAHASAALAGSIFVAGGASVDNNMYGSLSATYSLPPERLCSRALRSLIVPLPGEP